MALGKNDFKEKVLAVLKTDEFKTGGSELRIVQWVVKDKAKPPRLERRDFFFNEHGRMNGKAKGLTMDDLKIIFAEKDKIFKLMQGMVNNVKPLTEKDRDPFQQEADGGSVEIEL